MNADTIRVRIADDALALACGADAVADAFAAAGCAVERVSSWGMHWLEPLVEIDGLGFGPVNANDVHEITNYLRHSRESGNRSPELSTGETPEMGPRFGGNDEIWGGRICEHRFIASQQRLTFARAGRSRALSLEDYESTGGWSGLRRARGLSPVQVRSEEHTSELQSR